MDDYRRHKGKAERAALATIVGNDGLRVRTAVADPDAPDVVRTRPAITIVRWVWLQPLYAPEADQTGPWIMPWWSDIDRAGQVNAAKMPKDLLTLGLLADLSDTRAVGAFAVLNPLFGLLARIARKRGLYAKLLEQYAPQIARG